MRRVESGAQFRTREPLASRVNYVCWNKLCIKQRKLNTLNKELRTT